MNAALDWLMMAVCVTGACIFWLAYYDPKRRVSLSSLLVLLTLLAVAFAVGRLYLRRQPPIEFTDQTSGTGHPTRTRTAVSTLTLIDVPQIAM
jgi:hypothetical protein